MMPKPTNSHSTGVEQIAAAEADLADVKKSN